MAEGIRLGRRTGRRVVTDTMGRGPRTRHELEGELGWSGRETLMLALPVDISALQPIQDPATGLFYFMVGLSSVGGPDEIGS